MWLGLLFILFISVGYAQDTLIGAWHTITPPAGTVNDTTMLICVEFNRTADSVEILDKTNYLIKDNLNKTLPIYETYWITTIDNIDVDYTRLIGLRVPKLKYKAIYSVKYVAQADTFFYNGFAPNLIAKPNVQIR